MSPVEVITSIQRRSIPINSSNGGVLSMKVPFWLPKVKNPLYLFLR